jgi:hypothetical protein
LPNRRCVHASTICHGSETLLWTASATDAHTQQPACV